MAREKTGRGISRRQLLIGGGAGVGLYVAWRLWPRSYAPNLRAREGETLFNAFLKIGRDGRVSVAVPQTELGQGVYTSLPQILADELGADWRTVGVEPAPVSPLYANTWLAEEAADDSGWPAAFQGVSRWVARGYATRNALMITGGSTSVRAFERSLREAGAAARVMLCMAAAERWGANWEELETREGFVWREQARLPFAELAEAAPGHRPPTPLPMRDDVEGRLAGQPLPRLDAPAKIDGSALIAAGVRFPDTVFAALRSGPWGSRLGPVDTAAARAVVGALRIFEFPDWVAAVGTNWWAAWRAVEALKPRFHLRRPLASNDGIGAALNAALDADNDDRVFEAGTLDNGFPGASPVEARYEVGLAPAAAIEPLTATARIVGDGIEVYAPSQAPGLARAAIARAAGFAEDRVPFFPTLAGGGYGRKLETMAIEQAAILAVRMRRPVQLTWSRLQEIQRESWRPAAQARMTGWMKQGRIEAWRARIGARHRRRGRGTDRRRQPPHPPWPCRGRRRGAALRHRQCRGRPPRCRSRDRDRPVARRRAQLHLLFHRMLHRRARPRRRARAARLPQFPAAEQSAACPLPRHRRLDRRLGRRHAGQRHGAGLPQRLRFAHRLSR